MAVGDTAVKTSSPTKAEPSVDTSQVRAAEHNALGQLTDYQKLKNKQKLRHQLWQRKLLRRQARTTWLHLGHTSNKCHHQQAHNRNLEAKAWAEAVTSNNYSRAAQHAQAATIARDIQVEDQFRFSAGRSADDIAAMVIPALLALVTSSALDLTPQTIWDSTADSTLQWNRQRQQAARKHSHLLTNVSPTHTTNKAATAEPASTTPTAGTETSGVANSTPAPARSLGCLQGAQSEDNQEHNQAAHQKKCRDAHWDLVHEATSSADYKEYTKCKKWRSAISQAHSNLLHAVDATGDQLAETTELIRSAHPGRALPGTNPTRLAFALQPAVEQGLLTQQQADSLISIAAKGIQAEDFRVLEGEALDLSVGNTELPEDEELLLDFYYAQCGAGRVLCFPETDAEYLDRLGSIVLSPSFLHRVPGKKPRPILNLSSTDNGVNQRMDDLDADHDGYTTIPKIAHDIITTYIDMVQNPTKYNIDDADKIDMSMFVADASDAFFSVPVSAKLVGMQSTRVAGITIIPMCCSFGWRRSAEVFSHITASIIAVQKSDLTSMAFTAADVKQQQLKGRLKQFTDDKIPAHACRIKGHVDDYVIYECSHDDRQTGAAQDLVFAIKAHLGQHSVSAKKYLESSFWADLQKVIGAWFDTHKFTVTMPHEKIQEAIDILESEHFAPTATEFQIDICATLRGKMRWALYATKIGDSAALINIERQRQPGKTNARKVKPRRHHGETQEMATRKFHNDMLIYKLMLYACRSNPRVATASMVSLLPLQQRLQIPGQSKWLVWLSGDFSMLGQSYGIEMWHPEFGHIKRYAVIKHPQATIDALRHALAGKSVKGVAIVSSVCERLNKLMGEFHFRDLIKGRPCMCLEDNQGSVACINSGYANNVHLQAMQLASNLRQSVDEAPMEASYCNTENMSWFDKTSRMEAKFCEKMNADLKDLGLVQWQEEQANADAHAISDWLPQALESMFPMLDTLLQSLKNVQALSLLPAVTLTPDDILTTPDFRWQDRITAAAREIPHYMGSFGPMAYDTSHIATEQSLAGSSLQWSELREQNDLLATVPCYSVFDAYSGGCGATVAAINAGMFVKSGSEIEPEEIDHFEALTGRTSLGDITLLQPERIPATHVWISCSSCKDFSGLGSRKGTEGTKGGDHFTKQFRAAAASGCLVVVLENVDGVATLHNGAALRTLIQNAHELGYTQFFSERVTFSEHGDPENRSRRIMVAFHETVQLHKSWQFPQPTYKTSSAGEILQCSTHIPAQYWDQRRWQHSKARWPKNRTHALLTVGFKNWADKVGNPKWPNRVWHPMGLFPTCLASGNTGLVRWPRLRWMCSKHSAFLHWAITAKVKCNSQPAGSTSCIAERRVTPAECLRSKGFPRSTPIPSDRAGYRFAGNAVPVAYFTELLTTVATALDAADSPIHITPKPDEYVTYGSTPTEMHDAASLHRKLGMPAKAKVGHNIVHNVSRAAAAHLPLHRMELTLMQDRHRQTKFARLAEDSLKAVKLGWKHWESFCHRFRRPKFLAVDTVAQQASAAAQAELFINYECAVHDIRADTVVQKLWAVSAKHKQARMPDPFHNNSLLKSIIANNTALDDPSLPKVPVTNSTLKEIRRNLQLHRRPDFVLWVGIRFAIAYLCRISEWAINDKHTVRWEHLVFYTHKRSAGGRQKINLTSADQLEDVAELQVIFHSDKTARPGEGRARSFHAIPDKADSRCIVRDMARLWLISERIPDYDVFSWAANTKGVTRPMVNTTLKTAAVAVGIPKADVSSHSLRCSGLSRLCSNTRGSPMPWELAKKFGRWKSDCALKYFWASAEIAEGYAASLWDSTCFVRTRGDGALQFLH